MQIVSSFCWYFFWDEWFVQNINVSGKGRIFDFPGFGHIQNFRKKSSNNIMSNFLDRFSICFLQIGLSFNPAPIWLRPIKTLGYFELWSNIF
jgi:hypothetical protein